MNNQRVVCLRCATQHFQVTRAYAEAEVASFNVFFAQADGKTRDMFGNREASVVSYEMCMRCGESYKNFRDVTQEEMDFSEKMGFTINPVIDRCE